MKASTLLFTFAALMANVSVSASHLTQMIPRTETSATPTTTFIEPTEVPTETITPDPWQCITENITQYFDVPKPTGSLFTALISYGEVLIEPCVATATGLDVLDCSVTDMSQWCGFTTAAPTTILTAYSSYGSAAASFWSAKSAQASEVASMCPIAWEQRGKVNHAWLNQTIVQAGCYVAAHPSIGNSTTTRSSVTSSTARAT